MQRKLKILWWSTPSFENPSLAEFLCTRKSCSQSFLLCFNLLWTMAHLAANLRYSMLFFLRFLRLWVEPCLLQESESAKSAVGSDGAEGL